MRKFKAIKLVLSTAVFVAAFAVNAYAGGWMQDSTGWWYDWGNGSWPSSSWQWIDGNSDGIAECYYFDRFGYCMINTTTPDNYQVNASGAWVEGGTVQTRNVGVQKSSNSIKTSNSSIQKSSETKKKEEEKKKEQQQTEEQQEEQREETQKTNQYGGKYLYDMNPILNHYVNKESSLSTNKEDKTITRVLGSDGGDYIEYVAGKKYTKFKATVAPIKSNTSKYVSFIWDQADRMVLQVMGDGTELYVTPDIYYNTDMFDIEVDISGYDIIRLNTIDVNEGAYIGLINARFE